MNKISASDEILKKLDKKIIFENDLFLEKDYYDFLADEIILYLQYQQSEASMYVILVREGLISGVFRGIEQLNIDANPEKTIPLIMTYLTANKIKIKNPAFKLLFEKINDNVTIKVDNFLK